MPEEKVENKDDKVDLGQLTEALKGLPEGVQKAVKDAIHEVSGEQNAARVAAAKAAAEDKDDDDIDDEDFDVERVSRTELVSHLDKRFARSINKALKPIIDRLETTSTDAETDRVRREFAKAKEDFPDFMEWKEEMRDIITAHPELSAEDIYLLARAKDPKKVKEIDDKSGEDKKEEDEKELSKRKQAFGGLTPTSGKSIEKDGKKQPKEAATAAWDEIMGQVPKELLDHALEVD
ncbi:hypothetical protein LCGC14_2106150 [marine sediment metagenome]|uniref:Uncharacterized protein n=1 Tax=marine sediment metagenome TaxID=412755 RepID=A0A0F9E8G7_9ZZZZ